MIDGYSLIFNSLWILALAGFLAVISKAYFVTRQQHLSFRKGLGIRINVLLMNFCLLIFCIGIAGSVGTTLERGVWMIMALIWGGQLIIGIRKV